jgi:glycolate oxidase FAD binding subunit
MTPPLTPTTLEELADALRSAPRVLAVGAGTKPRLAAVEVVKISTAKLRGITEYDPSEFTFTALAGTPVSEISAVLAERGQYLPFDPMLAEAGATLGGTVAAGLSGPGRFRYGGVRDFILGVRFVDGAGHLLRMGGKVVKNAAGFDLPKFFVGSLGRFGALGELTFKVFPRPSSSLTVRLYAQDMEAGTRVITEAASSRFEFTALDVVPGDSGILARLAGPSESLELLVRDVLARWPGERLADGEAVKLWHGLGEFHWVPAAASLVKIAMSPASLKPLVQLVTGLNGAQIHVSAGGNVAFVALADLETIPAVGGRLHALGLPGVTLRGPGPLWMGCRPRPAIGKAVKQALDPESRFPNLDD